MGDKYDDTEWFRSSRWTPAIAEAFETRLQRARPDNRQQYVRIQATHLVAQDESAVREAGRVLLRRIAYGDGPYDFESLTALEQLGSSLLADGKLDEAESVLREVLLRIETLPSGRSGTSHTTELTLAELALERGGPDALAEADRLLDIAEPHVQQSAMFRNLVLRFLVCRARVAAALGRPEAGGYARQALEIASETTPSLPRHPDLGRPVASAKLRRELARIAKAR